MTHALDCSKAADTVGRRKMRPHHKTEAPKPLCQVDPDDPGLAAVLIVEKVRANQRASRGMTCLTYVFIDPEMTVYAISEMHTAAREWAADLGGHWLWLVGVYSSAKRPRGDGMTTTVEGVRADVVEHIADLRRVLA